jgi:hypothetical protein
VDFEFAALTGERPTPLCCVARELRSGRLVRRWLGDDAPASPPYGVDPGSLFVGYYVSAEISCHLALDWPVPLRILDLFTEFRCLTNGQPTPCGSGLLGALNYFGLDALDAAEKESMRQLALRGGPYTDDEKLALLDYCQCDVDSLARLLQRMLPHIDRPRALLRGRYMAAAARMEHAGVPIDADALGKLRENWDRIKSRLIARVDKDYGVFIPTGQRTLDPNTVYGAAVLEMARDWDIEPHQLADAADHLWRMERESVRDSHEARKEARKLTGLTAKRINSWEDAGYDSASFPGLDMDARTLAGRYPALGIGEGYRGDTGVDDTDYAGRLWAVLRNNDERTKPRHDRGILHQAAEMVSAAPEDTSYQPMTFSAAKFAEYLQRQGIPWPMLDSGALALDDDTFREQARAYPEQIGPIRELRHALSQLRLNELAVGTDGRNRCLLSAFRARTGRNQPSNSKFIFGPSAWLRSLIRPAPGMAVAYVDYSQQELAIAAALSGDRAMWEAYTSGDFYLTFAKMAGAAPPDATKKTHAATRDQFKTVALGVLYGLSAEGLARKLGEPACKGRELLRMHKATFPVFWKWSDAIEAAGMLGFPQRTVFGWTYHPGADVNPRALRNFPMQANGAEMLRLACCLSTERGVTVCCPVHDALLIEADADAIDDAVSETQRAMREASELVLPGFPLRTEAKVVRWPDRYADDRGRRMWEAVWELVEEDAAEALEMAEPWEGDVCAGATPTCCTDDHP